MSKAQKREAKDNHRTEELVLGRKHAVRQRGHHTVNQNVQHNDPKWVRVLSNSGVDTGAIQMKKSPKTIIQRYAVGGGWRAVSPNEKILTPAQIAAREAKERDEATYLPEAPAPTTTA